MDDQPRKILCDLIKQHGRSLCDDPILLRNILLDKCGEFRREIHSLVSALQERVPQDLLMSSSIPIEVLLSRLTIKLQDHLPVTPEAARWAVESWALAIGVISPADLTASDDKLATDFKPPGKNVHKEKAGIHQTSVIPDSAAKIYLTSFRKWAIIAGIVAIFALGFVSLLRQNTVPVTRESSQQTMATSPATPKEERKPLPAPGPSDLFEQGKLFCEAKNYEKALQAYRQAIRLKPDYAEAYGQLGVAYSHLGRLNEAVQAFEQAIRLKPDLALAHYNLGVAYSALGNYEGAQKEYITLKNFDETLAKELSLKLANTPTASLGAAEVHPIIFQLFFDGLLLGSASGKSWLDGKATALLLRGGEQYQLYTVTRKLGVSTGKKPSKLTEFEPDLTVYAVNLLPKPKIEDGVVGLSCPWNPWPREPRLIHSEYQLYKDAAAKILRSKGIANPRLKLTQVIRVDLDGDGVEEVLVTATFFAQGVNVGARLKDGDYSMVFLHREAQFKPEDVLLEGVFYPQAKSDHIAHKFTILGVLDVNGDGRMEVIVGGSYYEGGGAMLYHIDGKQVNKVLEVWAGL